MRTDSVFRWSGATGEPIFTPYRVTLTCELCGWQASNFFHRPCTLSYGFCRCGIEQRVTVPEPT